MPSPCVFAVSSPSLLSAIPSLLSHSPHCTLHSLSDNLLFNTCRESSDHGAFNSWDRLPYVTTIRDGSTPSTVPAFTEAFRNLIVANYGADGGCLDTDDGTSYYKIHDNGIAACATYAGLR